MQKAVGGVFSSQITIDGLFSSLLKQTVLQKIVYLRRNIKGTDLILSKHLRERRFEVKNCFIFYSKCKSKHENCPIDALIEISRSFTEDL